MVVVSMAAVLLLGACGGDHGDMAMDPGSGSMMPGMDGGDMGSMGGPTGSAIEVPDDAEFNAVDVAFAQQMVVHHGQAIAMSDMVLRISDDPEVLALAEQIKAAQDPEISTMTAWLETWGYDVAGSMPGMPGGDMGSMGSVPMSDMPMSGMMTDDEMAALGSASGVDVDRMFLTMMIRHHEGAIEMAEQLLSDGEYAPAQELGQAIITAQQTEIETMQSMLAARPG